MRFKNLARAVTATALGLTMAFSTVTPAIAATITVNNTQAGETYRAYKLFDVSVSGSAYSYSTSDSNVVNGLESLGLQFTTSQDGTVYYPVTDEMGENFKTASGTLSAEELAKSLNSNYSFLGNAAATDIVPDGKTSVTLGDGKNDNGDVDSLDAGYYFVTSSVGTLCFLKTNNESISFSDKNESPKVEKEAETSNKNGTVQIGDEVDYVITVTIQPGAKDYILHDHMSEGLTFSGNESVEVSSTDLNFDTNDYNVTAPTCGDSECTFEVSFEQDYLNSIDKATEVVIKYSAVVNKDAVTDNLDPLTNQAILSYGNNSTVKTEEGLTKTYTYDFILNKTDDEGQPLSDAKFKLYDSTSKDNATGFIFDESTNTYRVAADTETSDANYTDVITAGTGVRIAGLAGKTYYLEETESPKGYNRLDHLFTIEFKLKTGGSEDNLADWDLTNADVVNNTGAILPGTGGMGTTTLYVVGGVLVVAAGVTLVVRRRMSAEH